MASYGNSIVATNVFVQRPIKMNYQTGLTTINATSPTLDIRETGVEINGLGEVANIGLQQHAAYDVSWTEPAAQATSTLTLTIPGTSSSSAYKPEIEILRTLSAQYGATGEDDYIVRTAANSFTLARVGRSGNNLVGTVRVVIRFSANTDALQPNS